MPSRLLVLEERRDRDGMAADIQELHLDGCAHSRRSCRAGSVGPGAMASESAKFGIYLGAPIYRHRGVCGDLVRALATRERWRGATQLLLWVLDGNQEALRAYAALGFLPGEPQYLQAFERWEQRLGVQISCLTQPMPTAGSLSLDHGPSFKPKKFIASRCFRRCLRRLRTLPVRG